MNFYGSDVSKPDLISQLSVLLTEYQQKKIGSKLENILSYLKALSSGEHRV